jgi:hypothetical protein
MDQNGLHFLRISHLLMCFTCISPNPSTCFVENISKVTRSTMELRLLSSEGISNHKLLHFLLLTYKLLHFLLLTDKVLHFLLLTDKLLHFLLLTDKLLHFLLLTDKLLYFLLLTASFHLHPRIMFSMLKEIYNLKHSCDIRREVVSACNILIP